MLNNEENTITIIDEDGNEELCEILFTFDSEDFGKSYILYYPIGAEEDENEEIEIYAASYDPKVEKAEGSLKPIESDEEWDMVEEVLATFLDSEEEDK